MVWLGSSLLLLPFFFFFFFFVFSPQTLVSSQFFLSIWISLDLPPPPSLPHMPATAGAYPLVEPAHGFYLAWTFNHNNILCIQIFTFKLEKVHGPPGPQLEISSKEGWKEHTLFGQKHTLLGSGVSRALTKKIYTLLFLHCQNPLAKNGTARSSAAKT